MEILECIAIYLNPWIISIIKGLLWFVKDREDTYPSINHPNTSCFQETKWRILYVETDFHSFSTYVIIIF